MNPFDSYDDGLLCEPRIGKLPRTNQFNVNLNIPSPAPPQMRLRHNPRRALQLRLLHPQVWEAMLPARTLLRLQHRHVQDRWHRMPRKHHGLRPARNLHRILRSDPEMIHFNAVRLWKGDCLPPHPLSPPPLPLPTTTILSPPLPHLPPLTSRDNLPTLPRHTALRPALFLIGSRAFARPTRAKLREQLVYTVRTARRQPATRKNVSYQKTRSVRRSPRT